MRRRTKVSVSLPTDLVLVVDRHAAAVGSSRSVVMEEWVRVGSRVQEDDDLDHAIEAYYGGMDKADRDEGEALGKALHAASAEALARSDAGDGAGTGKTRGGTSHDPAARSRPSRRRNPR